MSDGRNRVDLPYTFPSSLRLPDVCLVYLDLNHWINLSKCISKHKDRRRYRKAFEACSAAVDENRAIFPISLSTVMEINAIQQPRQRMYLRKVIERISGFRAVLPRWVTAALEFEQVLATQLNDISRRTAPLDYIGIGVAWAIGQPLTPTVLDQQGRDVTTEALTSMPPEHRQMFNPDNISYLMTQMVIDGPANPSEEADLRAKGWNPEVLTEFMEDRVCRETQLVSELNEHHHRDPSSVDWRKSRLRDVVAARELLHETNEVFSTILVKQGLTFEDIFDISGQSNALQQNRSILDTMPTFDVAVTLKASYHRNPNHPWKSNDIFDIDAMSTVLPYCNVVVTDKAMASHINQTKLARRLDTEVLSSLGDLIECLTEARS